MFCESLDIVSDVVLAVDEIAQGDAAGIPLPTGHTTTAHMTSPTGDDGYEGD